jgi:hypothetical protein
LEHSAFSPESPIVFGKTSTTCSGTQRCFELVFGPLDRVVELFTALRELGLHHRIDRLVVDLRADFGARRGSGDLGLFVAAGRMLIVGTLPPYN